jgi:hypothetical protein
LGYPSCHLVPGPRWLYYLHSSMVYGEWLIWTGRENYTIQFLSHSYPIPSAPNSIWEVEHIYHFLAPPISQSQKVFGVALRIIILITSQLHSPILILFLSHSPYLIHILLILSDYPILIPHYSIIRYLT